MSARGAARRFGVSADTARRRAREAVAAGDQRIEKLPNGWFAQEEWWRMILTRPVKRGRPRKTTRP